MAATAEPLRVIDFGEVSPLRSQTLWHAVAHGVSAGAPATLSFVRPAAPYVSIGYHRELGELDLDFCRQNDLPVMRRMVGGGPVYLDPGQLFFQIALPVSQVPASRHRALADLLAPAVEAFRAVGVPANLDEHLEITVGGAKVCGHGAGQIGEAVVVCGNVIETFDHARATAILSLGEDRLRDEVLRLMRRHVRATPLDVDGFRAAAVRGYANALGRQPQPGELTAVETAALAELDAQFCDPAWVGGTPRPAHPARQVKVRAGVWAFSVAEGDTRVVASVRDGRLDRAWLSDPGLNGSTVSAQRAVRGLRLAEVGAALAAFGDPGQRLASAFAAADGRGCV